MRKPIVQVETPFQRIWWGAYAGADEQLRRLWARLRDDWLRENGRSPHTRRSYETASNQWLDWLATRRQPDGGPLQPWTVTAADVRAWVADLHHRGLAAATVNQRLAACSSFYRFVIDEVHLVDGVERSAFFDADGRTRSNPFLTGNVRRPRFNRYHRAAPLSDDDLGLLLGHLESRKSSRQGSRNYALLLTYLLTGWRSAEVLSMTWGAIRRSRSQADAYVYLWRGKGGLERAEVLPARVYDAIVGHLSICGRRIDIMDPSEYLWRPLRTGQIGNLRNQSGIEEGNRHISSKSARGMLRRSLRSAGVSAPERYRIHDLRHTFALRFHNHYNDIEKLRHLLHHSNLATTGIYVRDALADPVDDWSERLYGSLLRSKGA